ncbi:hypothetical protein [Streptomyces sioyaensis]|uniref:hypothetical protein n=1 Tax=Streptomyces sioyaensis TaxID=67364 RepID=UPI003EB69DC1
MQETFDAWWHVITQRYENTYRFAEIRSDAAHLRLWRGEFHPNAVSVVELDLLAHRDDNAPKSVVDVRTKASAGLEVLAAIAQFPGWLTQFFQLTIDIAGCQLHVSERPEREWGFVPAISWKAPIHPIGPVGLFLGAADEGKQFSGSARPELVL